MAKYPNLFKVLYMNGVLTFHLSLCLSLASLLPQISKQNHYESLGEISIIFIYVVNLAFNLIGPLYLSKIKYRFGFTLQALLSVPSFVPAYYVAQCNANDITNTICQNSVIYSIMIIGCISLGAGLGGYFVLQNTYVSDCTTTEKHKELYFGITYMLLGCAYLLNGVISEILLEKIGREHFFFYAGVFQVGLSLLFLFVPQPQKIKKVQEQEYRQVSDINNNSDSQQTNSLSDKLCQDQNQLSNDEFSQLPIKQQLMFMWDQVQTDSMRQLLPLFMSTGCVIGFEFGIFHQFISDSLPKDMEDIDVNKKTARIFLYLGIAQVLMGIINGVLKTFIGILNLSIIYPMLTQCMITLGLTNCFIKSYLMNNFLGVLIGMCDNNGQFTTVVLISDIWNESMCVFGIYLFFQNFGVILINAVAIVVDGYNLYYNLVILLFIQCLTSIMQQKFKRNVEKKYIQ